ncbi:MAG TPA: ABC transporter permease [Puia sp.]|nr:ABC transporter permease [Puia sp.]
MIKNLILVALRNFKRDIWYTLINVAGLTIGITFSLFLIFYIKNELSYDRYNLNGDRIFRINSFIKEPEKDTMKTAITQFPLGPELKKDFPEVEEMVRFVGNGKTMFKNGDIHLYEEKVYYCDSGLFRIFTCRFIDGNPEKALVEPNSIVLTESVAIKYFGKVAGLIGKTLQNDKGDIYRITAVIKDVPKNSHIIFNAAISTSSLPKDFADNWGGFGFYTYVLLKPMADAASFEKKLLPLYDKHMAPIFAQFNIKIHYRIQPITAIHLHSGVTNEPEESGSTSYIYILGAVALFMLFIACINYMNLTTARSARRAKEIGIRKVTGSSKSLLVYQFLIESTLLTIFALLLSMLLVALLLPTFNLLSGKLISLSALFEQGTFLVLLAVIIFVGLIGGSYPALYLSKFKPVDVLKGSLSKGSSNVTLRRSLVVVQFSISMAMIICTWVVFAQLRYLRNIDLGFDKNQVMTLSANSSKDISARIASFKDEIRKIPEVISVSTATSVPGGGLGFNLFSIETKSGYTQKGVSNFAIDEDFLRTLGMKIRTGRGFLGLPDTLRSAIVNENMVKYYGWDNPIGKKIKVPGDTSSFYYEVVGVVKDFNQASLYNPITPIILFYRPNNTNFQLKLDQRSISSTLPNIEKVWKTAFPELPFQYSFLDQDLDSQYAADQKRGKIFTTFSILTIMITCLGLLGLVAFTTQQRQKEISIRKIMGAGVAEISQLITSNFILLVGISCLFAFPVAYFFMDKWLNIFPYKTRLTFTPFLGSGLVVLAITLLTVIYHTIRAALANPSRALRTE